jgi:hypothetical protein
MSHATTAQLEAALIAHITERVSCRALKDDGRIGCLTPAEYPDGDNVVVWLRPLIGGEYEVTDYGDALAESVWGKNAERRALEGFATLAAKGQGVEYAGGRLLARCGWSELPEYVWRLATAATQLSQAAVAMRPRRSHEVEFTAEVEQGLRSREVEVARDHRISGASGHRHKATIFLPESETVIEPVAGHWNQVTAVYAKLGDVGRANGYRLYSLLDDREARPSEDVANMLVQVSAVVQWSRRDEWLDTIIPSDGGGRVTE